MSLCCDFSVQKLLTNFLCENLDNSISPIIPQNNGLNNFYSLNNTHLKIIIDVSAVVKL